MIDVTLLGSSALLPTPERALTAAVLRCGGRTILFDCGEGTQTAARKAGVSLMKTDLIALTHYHGDHIGSWRDNYATFGWTPFDKDGNNVLEFVPGGSDYPVILGAGISNSGNYLAAISGHSNQRFVLAEKKGDRAKIIFHKEFDNELSRQMLVKFRQDESAVYYSCSDGLGVVNCRSLESSVIPLEGDILSIQEDEDGTVFVLSKDDSSYSVSVIEAYNVYSGSFSFDAEAAFMSVKDGSLFVGHDSKISRIDIQRK
jgi:ribonuclease BN (tRNA processing enzyme)